MKAVGRMAGAIIVVMVLLAGLVLLFNFMRAAREQTVAAPPTPVTPASAPQEAQSPAGEAAKPEATPEEASIHITSMGYPGPWQPEALAPQAGIVVIGTVKEKMPARWGTPDGKRPPGLGKANIPPQHHTIYTPVAIDVDEYLKNPQPDPIVMVSILGGKVGKDSMVATDAVTLEVGEKVLLFLATEAQLPDGTRVRAVNQKYTLKEDGTSIAGTRPDITLETQELLDRTKAAIAAGKIE